MSADRLQSFYSKVVTGHTAITLLASDGAGDSAPFKLLLCQRVTYPTTFNGLSVSEAHASLLLDLTVRLMSHMPHLHALVKFRQKTLMDCFLWVGGWEVGELQPLLLSVGKNQVK